MSALLNKKKIARAKRARKQRRYDILEAAAHLFINQPYLSVTIDAVGRRAGVPSGIASLYFDNKDELFLEVLQAELGSWFENLAERLGASQEPLDREGLAGMLLDDIAGRPALTRLLSLLQIVLEQNVEILPAQSFIYWLRDRALALAGQLEQRCPFLEPGEGIVFLRRLELLLVGLGQLTNLSGIFAAILADEDLSNLHADYREELRELVMRMLPSTD